MSASKLIYRTNLLHIASLPCTDTSLDGHFGPSFAACVRRHCSRPFRCPRGCFWGSLRRCYTGSCSPTRYSMCMYMLSNQNMSLNYLLSLTNIAVIGPATGRVLSSFVAEGLFWAGRVWPSLGPCSPSRRRLFLRGQGPAGVGCRAFVLPPSADRKT